MNCKDGDLIIYESFDDTSDYPYLCNWEISCDIYDEEENGYYHNRPDSEHYRKLYIIPKEDLKKYKIS